MESPSLAPGLTKLAEAAGKKMRKLRRNWSLKKNDISRSLSRIRKSSAGSRLTSPVTPSGVNVVVGASTISIGGDSVTPSRPKPTSRRTPSFWLPDAKSVVRQHGGPVVGDGSPGDTTFYITLTIEQDEEDEEEEEESGPGDVVCTYNSCAFPLRVSVFLLLDLYPGQFLRVFQAFSDQIRIFKLNTRLQ